MSDLISRSALLEEIKRELERGRANDPFFDGTLFHYTGIKAIIENQPTAYDVVEGEWIFKIEGTYSSRRAYCSVCGKRSGIGGIRENQMKPYCPNCGAKMKVGGVNA